MFTSITSRIPIAPVRRRGAMGSLVASRTASFAGAASFSSPALFASSASFGGGITVPIGAGGYRSIVGSGTTTGLGIIDNGLIGLVIGGSYSFLSVRGGTSRFRSDTSLGWTSGNADSVPDLYIMRDAANALALRGGSSAQSFRVYNTTTATAGSGETTIYERGFLTWSSNEFLIGTEKAGTGVARPLKLQTDGTTRITLSATGSLTLDTSVVASNAGLGIASGVVTAVPRSYTSVYNG